MGRRLLPLTLLLLLLSPAGALAQGEVTVSLTPAKAGKPSRLELSASGEAISSGGEAPRSLSLSVARGFRLEPRSRAARCSAEQAGSYACPAASRIATGKAEGHATVPVFGNFPFTATIEAFLTPKVQAGDTAGVVVQANEPSSGTRTSNQGRVVPVSGGAFGSQILFGDFALRPPPSAPPGTTVQLDRFELTVEAKRRVRTVRIVKRRVKRHGKRKIRRRRKVRIRRYYLINNPRTCAGSWPYQARASFPTRPEVVRDGSIPCSR